MKRALVALIPVLLALPPVAFAHGDDEGPVQTIEGELVDVACYVDHGGRGPKHQGCATACAQNNLPIGILDAKNQLFLVVDDDHKPMNDKLASKMASHVKATGHVHTRGGVRLIEVEKIE